MYPWAPPPFKISKYVTVCVLMFAGVLQGGCRLDTASAGAWAAVSRKYRTTLPTTVDCSLFPWRWQNRCRLMRPSWMLSSPSSW